MTNEQREIWHALMEAAVREPEKLNALLAEYPDILAWRNGVGETALHYLAIEDCQEAALRLIRAGAEVNTQCDMEDTPLASCAMLGHAAMCRLLIEHGAAIETTNNCLETPMHYAARHPERLEVLEALLECGADPNVRDDFEKTPLHEAVGHGNLVAAELLLAKGADVNASGSEGGPPILNVSGDNALALVQLLLKHGADLHAVDEDDSTLLHHAAFEDLPELMQFCLDNAFDPEARDRDGRTPADAANRGVRVRRDAQASMKAFKRELSEDLGEDVDRLLNDEED